MPTVQVKLNPVSQPIANGAGAARTRVTGLKVELNLQGAGASLVTTSPQTAELRFYEVARSSDRPPARPDEHFATLGGTLALDGGGAPVFDASGKMLVYRPPGLRSEPKRVVPSWFPPDVSTDWFLDLDLAAPSFTNTEHGSKENARLFLPWLDFDREDGTIDIGCELTVGGQPEFRFDERNVVSVSLLHPGVLLDGDEPTSTAKDAVEHQGVGCVHPTRNHLIHTHRFRARAVTFAPGGPRLRVVLHEGLSVVVKSMDRVRGFLDAAFNGIGIVVDHETGRTDAQARSAGFEHKADPFVSGDTTWIATDTDQGTTLPFFTYWVFHVHRVDDHASGLSEDIVSVRASGATSEKSVRYPIRLIGGRDGTDRRGIERDLEMLAKDEDKDLHVANIIAHEIGHSFGFDHALQARGGDAYKLRMTNPDFSRCVMAWENLGSFTFTRPRRFGPVFTAMLRRDFGLP